MKSQNSEETKSEKENIINECQPYPTRKRKAAKQLEPLHESNAPLLPSKSPPAKVHKRQRTASKQEQITSAQNTTSSDDKEEESKAKKAVPVVIPLSPRSPKSPQELRKQFPEDFQGVSDQLLKDQELYLSSAIKPLIRGRRCLSCDYLGPVRFDTVRHILLRHLKLGKFPCNHCKNEYKKLGDLKKHFFDAHSSTSGDASENQAVTEEPKATSSSIKKERRPNRLQMYHERKPLADKEENGLTAVRNLTRQFEVVEADGFHGFKGNIQLLRIR